MTFRMRDVPWVGLFISLLLILGPFPVWGYFLVPFAATTRDPDAIELLGFIMIPILMFIGAIVGVAALRDWKTNSDDNRPRIF